MRPQPTRTNTNPAVPKFTRKARRSPLIGPEPPGNQRVRLNPAAPPTSLVPTSDPHDRAHGRRDDRGYVPAIKIPPHQSRPRLYAPPNIVTLVIGRRTRAIGLDSHIERLQSWHYAVAQDLDRGRSARPVPEISRAARTTQTEPVGELSPLAPVAVLPTRASDQNFRPSSLHQSTHHQGQARLDAPGTALLNTHGFDRHGQPRKPRS